MIIQFGIGILVFPATSRLLSVLIIMDSSQNSEETGTVSEKPTVCSICFESFKTPRQLPCSHTFCHNCLSAYILVTCKQKMNPIGFPCPLCRKFAPAPVFPGNPEVWTEHFPINEMVQVISEKNDRICDACKRENEEEVASDWCKACTELLCPPCAKAHRRNIVSRSHKVIAISELNKFLEEDDEDYSYCHGHKKKVKYLCVDHEEPCCTQCVCTEHRTCTKLDSVEEATQSLKESRGTESLLLEIQEYKNALIKAKTEGENNIKDVEDKTDKITEVCTKLKSDIVTHVETLLENFLTDLSKDAKESREKVAVTVDAFSDQQILMDMFSKILKSAMEKSPSVFIKEYYSIKKQLTVVMQQDMSQLKITLETSASKELERILNISKFANFKFITDSCKFWHIDMTCATMHMMYELADSEGDITGGCFLENGNILLANARSGAHHCLHFCREKLSDKVSFTGEPRDVLSLNQELMLISFWNAGKNRIGLIEKVSKDNSLQRKEFCKFGNHINHVSALARSSAFIYAACDDFIVKLDEDGNIVKKFATDTSTFSVAVNKNNEIISSSCSSHSVSIMNEKGQQIYSYKHEKLKYPYSLDLDFSGNIFVAGRDSNNIHALSPKGELLKIFNVNSPRCIRFKENSYVCFIGTDKGTTKVYEFKP